MYVTYQCFYSILCTFDILYYNVNGIELLSMSNTKLKSGEATSAQNKGHQ